VRSTKFRQKFRQKAKSTLKLPKWVDGQAGAENQKAAEKFRGLVGEFATAARRGKTASSSSANCSQCK
jgi:hypothetical protein